MYKLANSNSPLTKFRDSKNRIRDFEVLSRKSSVSEKSERKLLLKSNATNPLRIANSPTKMDLESLE